MNEEGLRQRAKGKTVPRELNFSHVLILIIDVTLTLLVYYSYSYFILTLLLYYNVVTVVCLILTMIRLRDKSIKSYCKMRDTY